MDVDQRHGRIASVGSAADDREQQAALGGAASGHVGADEGGMAPGIE
ncbi:MAG: hypothetical protein ACRD2E_10580 [Terriglobales bacterium]